MKSLSLIHTSWLKPFADFFSKRRVSLRPYLEVAKIEAKQVSSGDGWITKQQLYRFLNAVVRGERMPELGFVVGESITPDKLGGIGVALTEAETLGQAIRIFCQLINRSSEENRAWLAEGDGGEVWLFDEVRNPFAADRRIADHAGLMSLINLVRLAGSGDWYPARVTLQTGSTTAFRRVRGLRQTDFQFDCPATGLAFPASWLLKSIELGGVPSDREPAGKGLLDDGEPMIEKLRRLLREIVGTGGIGPTVQLMAELCGTSSRSLHRRLQEQGISYRELLDEVRIERAYRQLENSQVAVKELAVDLGYSGANNFIRAFKRMTGLTPAGYRLATRNPPGAK